jgi:hypothetical protein
MQRSRVNRRPNIYTRAIARQPVPIDPYSFPSGGLGGLGDVVATGIPVVDQFIAEANKKADSLVLATQVGAVCSVIGAVAGLLLLFKDGRR